ncbi:HAD domain-containing protein [Actinoallomurus acanthiterrae]
MPGGTLSRDARRSDKPVRGWWITCGWRGASAGCRGLAAPAAKPLLYVDIDGVLNPTDPANGDGFTAHTIGVLTVRLSEEHGAWLRELADRYDLVWASTWEHRANEYVAPLLGLPELPVVEFSAYRRRRDDPGFPILELFEMAKWAPLLRHADGRPFAWVDDVIPARIKRQAWPYRGILLVRVDPRHGLTRHHVDRLLAWPRANR